MHNTSEGKVLNLYITKDDTSLPHKIAIS